MLDDVRRLGTVALVLVACAGGTNDTDPSGEMTGVSSAETSGTSGLASDSIATAWESTMSASDSSSSSTDDPSTTASTTTVDPTSESSGDESSSTGEPPPPVNLFDNPSLEQWTNAAKPNTTPDLWDNCTIGGLGVDAVPDSCDGNPAAQDGVRYARAFVGEGIEQTVETIPGVTYRISFDYAPVDDCFGGEPNARWEALVDEGQILVTRNANEIAWMSAEVLFEAQQPTTTICIRKFANGAGGLDNLSVVEAAQ
jgi:hypothetical protein